MASPKSISIRLADKEISRFWNQTRLNPVSGCLEWIGKKRPAGYGVIVFKHRKYVVSRIAYLLLYSKDPGEMFVCHTCDNPICVTKEHLFLGTHQDNVDDKVAKGRQAKGDAHYAKTNPEKLSRGDRHYHRTNPETIRKGEQVATSKLTQLQVEDIRARYIPGIVSLKMLGEEYGVTPQGIFMIVHRKNWKHTP